MEPHQQSPWYAPQAGDIPYADSSTVKGVEVLQGFSRPLPFAICSLRFCVYSSAVIRNISAVLPAVNSVLSSRGSSMMRSER